MKNFNLHIKHIAMYKAIDCLKGTVIYNQVQSILFDCFKFLNANRMLANDNTYKDINYTLKKCYSSVPQLRNELNRLCNIHYLKNGFSEILYMINEIVELIDSS